MTHHQDTIELLKRLIAIPSLSRQEDGTAELLFTVMQQRGFSPQRYGNNILAYNKHFSEDKQTIVLCSHHDTVPPNAGYTLDPYQPLEKEGRLYGLGSNDAGASLVSMLAVFSHFFDSEDLKYNLAVQFNAEEECSGSGGMEMMVGRVHNPHLYIVGEPTGMNVAVAERGLMVLDCTVEGVSGHAANYNTVNPITLAIDDIRWFSSFQFPRVSDVLGSVKMSVTIINAGTTHNTIPSECSFTVDVRSNGCYTNQEILEIVRQNVKCTVTPRSTRLNPSQIPIDHPFVQSCIRHGAQTFGSSTMSDQALIPTNSVKIGVGDTTRSHTANEWIATEEITQGIQKYTEILKDYIL